MGLGRRIAIVGSRGFGRLQLVWDFISRLPKDTVIVSGGARGVDSEAAKAARSYGLRLVEHYPDWSRGRGAGFERNAEIVADADEVVAFWDGESRGTADTIRKARAAGKRVRIIRYPLLQK